jgi:hypothetical protein
MALSITDRRAAPSLWTLSFVDVGLRAASAEGDLAGSACRTEKWATGAAVTERASCSQRLQVQADRGASSDDPPCCGSKFTSPLSLHTSPSLVTHSDQTPLVAPFLRRQRLSPIALLINHLLALDASR